MPQIPLDISLSLLSHMSLSLIPRFHSLYNTGRPLRVLPSPNPSRDFLNASPSRTIPMQPPVIL